MSNSRPLAWWIVMTWTAEAAGSATARASTMATKSSQRRLARWSQVCASWMSCMQRRYWRSSTWPAMALIHGWRVRARPSLAISAAHAGGGAVAGSGAVVGQADDGAERGVEDVEGGDAVVGVVGEAQQVEDRVDGGGVGQRAAAAAGGGDLEAGGAELVEDAADGGVGAQEDADGLAGVAVRRARRRGAADSCRRRFWRLAWSSQRATVRRRT
jgi:hypothetical protein